MERWRAGPSQQQGSSTASGPEAGLQGAIHGGAAGMGASPYHHDEEESCSPGKAKSGDVLSTCMWHLLPVMSAICLSCYLDRTSLAFAAVTMSRDLSLSPRDYGLGAGLFFCGYSLAMVPSQLVMMHVGARVWLATIVVAWGVCATLFCAVDSTTTFYVLRFLLGAAEAGAFPTMWAVLAQYLPPSELAVPFSVLEASVAMANVLAAPLAAGLLSLHGVAGLNGWQWLFLAEGLPTMVLGVVAYVVLPSSVSTAPFLTSSEKRWLIRQMEASQKAHQHVLISTGSHATLSAPAVGGSGSQNAAGGSGGATGSSSLALLWQAVMSARVWWVIAVGLLKNCAANGLLFWTPLLIRNLLQAGSHRQQGNEADAPATGRALLEGASMLTAAANSTHPGSTGAASSGDDQARSAVLLSSLPFACAAVLTVMLARSSQRKREFAMHLAVPYLLAATVLLALSCTPRHTAGVHSTTGALVLEFSLLVVALSCVQAGNPVLNSTIPVVAPSAASVPIALALYNSVSNVGGLLGPWLIGDIVSRTGRVHDAFTTLGVLLGLAAVMAASMHSWWPVSGGHT